MLVSEEETDTSLLFYLLKEQIKCKETNKSKKVFVPINNIDYSNYKSQYQYGIGFYPIQFGLSIAPLRAARITCRFLIICKL